MNNMAFLTQTGIDYTPVKIGKLPKSGKVNLVVQFDKHAITDRVRDQLMDMGAETDCDVSRPMFAFYDIDAKQARQIVAKNRQQLLCIMITTADYKKRLYEQSSTQTAYNFFLQWMSTIPTMYTKSEETA